MFRIRKLCFASRKGMGLISPNQDVDTVVATQVEFGDAGGSPGKRCLFFLTVLRNPGIRLSWSIGLNVRVKHLDLPRCPVRSQLSLKSLEDRLIHTPGRTHNRIRSPR